MENDILIFELDEPVSADKVLPMCDKSYANHTIAIAGMGNTKLGADGSPATVLQEAKFKEIVDSTCPVFGE